MRIGLNLLYLLPTVLGGSKTYAISLIKSLAAIDRENEYFIFLNKESKDLRITDAQNFNYIFCNVYAKYRPFRYFWEQVILPLQVRKLKLDILHSLGYVAPLFLSSSNVVSILDINYIAMKHVMPFAKQMILKFLVYASGHRAKHIITISDFSKHQIQKYLHISEDKITVIYLGSRDVDSNCTSSEKQKILAQYGIQKPYIVAFSSLSIHKNIPRLIEAYNNISSVIPHQLVLIGNQPQNTNLISDNQNSENRVISTGYVLDYQILPLIELAELFVFPSWYEGFGLPILEAQQVGVAITCSTAGSIPEVAGNAAIYFDPYSVEEMAEKILRCLQDEVLRTELVKKGKENLERFAWDQTARMTLSVYKEVSG